MKEKRFTVSEVLGGHSVRFWGNYATHAQALSVMDSVKEPDGSGRNFYIEEYERTVTPSIPEIPKFQIVLGSISFL